MEAGTGLEFPRHKGIKCYAVISKPCWVAIEGVPDAVRLKAGDCFILPHGLPFCVATDLSGPRARFIPELANQTPGDALDYEGTGRAFLLGGHFLLTGSLSITCLFCESFEQTWANMLGLPEPFGP